jgi:hypothetical protein
MRPQGSCHCRIPVALIYLSLWHGATHHLHFAVFTVSPSDLSKKIVSHDGKLYGKPSAILYEPYTLATLTTAEMAKFPWDKIDKKHRLTIEGLGGYPAYIIRYVPWNTHLSERFQNVYCIFMDQLEHGTVVLEFAKGIIKRTGSLVSRLSREDVKKIIALALDVPNNRAKVYPWLHCA